MNDKARTIREQHCAAIRRALQRILDNPAAGFETWFSKTTLAGLPPPSRMTDRELSMARHTLAQSRTRFMEEASMPTRQPAPAAFVPGGLQALVDMTGQPAMYGNTEVLPKAAPAAAAAQCNPDAAFAEFCDREGYPSDGPFDTALRKAFDAGVSMMISHSCRIVTQPPVDAAPVDAKPILTDQPDSDFRKCLRAFAMTMAEEGIKEGRGRTMSVASDRCRAVVDGVMGWEIGKGLIYDLLLAAQRDVAQRAASQDSERDAARWQFMVEVSVGPPALNAYAAALNERPLILHETPETRKAAFIAAVDKARQKMADQQAPEGGAA